MFPRSECYRLCTEPERYPLGCQGVISLGPAAIAVMLKNRAVWRSKCKTPMEWLKNFSPNWLCLETVELQIQGGLCFPRLSSPFRVYSPLSCFKYITSSKDHTLCNMHLICCKLNSNKQWTSNSRGFKPPISGEKNIEPGTRFTLFISVVVNLGMVDPLYELLTWGVAIPGLSPGPGWEWSPFDPPATSSPPPPGPGRRAPRPRSPAPRRRPGAAARRRCPGGTRGLRFRGPRRRSSHVWIGETVEDKTEHQKIIYISLLP